MTTTENTRNRVLKRIPEIDSRYSRVTLTKLDMQEQTEIARSDDWHTRRALVYNPWVMRGVLEMLRNDRNNNVSVAARAKLGELRRVITSETRIRYSEPLGPLMRRAC